MSDKRNKRRAGGFGPGHMRMPVQKPKNFRKTFRRLMGYLRPHYAVLVAVLITAVLSTIFTIIAPKLMGNATTKLFEGMMMKMKGVPGAHIDFNYIWGIVIALVLLYVLSSLFTFIMQYLMSGVSQKMVYKLRKQVNEKLARLPVKYYDAHPYGDVLSRAVNDSENISNTLQQSLTASITSIITLIGVVVMMLTISPLLTLVLLVTIPLSFIGIAQITKHSQGYFKQQQEQIGMLNGHVEEMFTGHQVIKAFGKERESVGKFESINGKLYNSAWKAQFLSGIMMPMMMFVGNIGYVLISVVGGILVIHRSIQIGDIQAFIQYARQFGQPLNQIANISNIIQSTIASAERIFEILDEEEVAADAEASEPLQLPKGRVTFDHVGFRYKEDQPLIEDMTIDVKAGQSVAIVGPTGAGKTTLVNLLMRFYEVREGKITVDGTDIRSIKRERLHQLFGMVLQDTWLFKGTIRENIAYGRIGATDEEIVCAAEAAHADHFIRTLPEGYDTILNEEGSNISQGQKQLLTIARAILADPVILILDEATSSVDTRTEVHIQKAMNALMKNRTSFVIAHRLSTIREADLILVMNHGRVIEQGTHHELLEKKGFYADLYNSQFDDEEKHLEIG
ncbi:ABC transporter ATP-binding protein/permease [Sporolactobacillus shoreicorticis]|uniref:ABC transporter ATP-binding protein n=1 Tax=Sporolactobacillus shoreicorticis TaxID=1923877 RepID=A0ABW5S977_9BACL|nr:ABC transporter ATP-binding protein [Sporolactobacillus shoreicorticis]MCO7127698.1 ABC transporter ATP-binding protein/permease [Sporolactobacillus shoreicorticis]